MSKRGGTLYDGNLRDKSTKGGWLDPNTGKSTQYWDDNYHYTRDPRPDKEDHWVNDNVPKGDSDRHSPPADAKK